MRIALVCPYDMIDHAGGVQQIVMHQAEGLRARGHTVKIITPRPFRLQSEPPDDYIFLGSSTKVRAVLATAGDIGFEIDGREIDVVLEKEKFDVINFHEPWIPVLARQIATRSRAAHVGTFHANLSDSTTGKSLANMLSSYGRGILYKMDVLTAVSPAAAGILTSKGSDYSLVKNIKYIPNGIDLKRYSRPEAKISSNPNQKTILYVGRLEGRKGLNYLLRAYKELTNNVSGVQLLIAGKGSDENKLREYVKSNNLPEVTFLGYISDEEKIKYLHKADIFCAPAHRGESFGIVLLEAMAAKCPIVAGDNSGYAAVMQDTGAISLVNPLDTVDFSRRMEILLYNQDLRKLWIKWASDYVKKYDWALVVAQYEDVYEQAIKLRKKRKSAIKNWLRLR